MCDEGIPFEALRVWFGLHLVVEDLNSLLHLLHLLVLPPPHQHTVSAEHTEEEDSVLETVGGVAAAGGVQDPQQRPILQSFET